MFRHINGLVDDSTAEVAVVRGVVLSNELLDELLAANGGCRLGGFLKPGGGGGGGVLKGTVGLVFGFVF